MDGRDEPRSEGKSWQAMLDEETVPVPAFFREQSAPNLGSQPIAASRYTSRAFFDQEVEKLWPRIWQFAAREEELPEVGDLVVYENVGRSFLLVRQADGSIKGFYNVCLHRGRKLRTEDGHASELECPFHGFTWNPDGSLKRIPCRWDFQHLHDDTMRLPEVRVGRWAGYVFICEDESAPALEEYLHPLPDHFKRWRMEECFTAVWVGKVIPCNWKATAEAFMEAWHSVVTHPQILPFTGDANSQYDFWGDYVSRTLTPFGVLSPHLEGKGYSEQYVIDAFGLGAGRTQEEANFQGGVSVPDGMTARQVLAGIYRQQFLESLGYDASEATMADMLDAWTYNVFPNFAPWGGFAPNIVYRWRPWPDQDHTLMEVRILTRAPKGAPVPRSVPMRFLGPDEPWTTETAWGRLGNVYEQDMQNLPYVQQGLKASKNGLVQLGNYQERRIRKLHQTLDQYLNQ
jgi:phenylpropionate dioxygenase-like ring-hydroxylating dioxygenase large terminal subunit